MTSGKQYTGAAQTEPKSPISLALKHYLVGQFGRPHGLVGIMAGWVMRQRRSNVRRNLWTIELMDLEPDCRVLEIGYGPGFALGQVCAHLGQGKAFGLDHSETMTRMAERRNRTHIETGKLRLFTGTVEDSGLEEIPELAGPFDRIYAVNVIRFWSDPVSVLTKLADRLADDGRILLTLQPRGGDLSEEGIMAIAETIVSQMKTAGLAETRTECLRDVTPMAICLVGRKSSQGPR